MPTCASRSAARSARHYDPKGKLGDAETIVNEILAYEPERMLTIRIKQAPASFQHRDGVAGHWTVLYFNPAGENMTHVRIVGLGYDDTPAVAGGAQVLRRRQPLDARPHREAVLAQVQTLREMTTLRPHGSQVHRSRAHR